MRSIILAVLAVLLLGAGLFFISGCSDGASSKSVAAVGYIYSADAVTAAKFKSLLETNGILTDLIPLSSLSNTDLSTFKLLVMADDTATEIHHWLGTADQAQQIKASAKPLIAVGNGTTLFDTTPFQLEIGYFESMLDTGTATLVSDPAYFTGITGAGTAGASVTVLTTSAYAVAAYGAHLTAASHTIGVDAVTSGYYPVCRQGIYATWGFITTPDKLTNDGKKLLVNLANALINPT